MENLPTEFIAYGILGGVLPTLVWLSFWVFEDRFCPEPRRLIIGAFVFGAFAALLTIPLQASIAAIFGASTFVAMFIFVSIEEYIKYMCCWYIALRDPHNNERIDPVIYLAIGALGFAALENTLYLLNYLGTYSLDIAVLEGSKRIVGATVLHTVSSAAIGICLAIAFRWSKRAKHMMARVGLILAIIIHIGFNHFVTFIGHPEYLLYAFGGAWVLLFVTIIMVEVVRGRVCPPVDYSKRPM